MCPRGVSRSVQIEFASLYMTPSVPMADRRREFYRRLGVDAEGAVEELLSATFPPPGMEEVIGFLRNLFKYCSQVIGSAMLSRMGVPSGATSRRAKHELEHIREACLQPPRPPRDFRTRELVEYARERIYEAEALADKIVAGSLRSDLGGRKTPGAERTGCTTDISSCLFGEYSVWGAKTPVALPDDSDGPEKRRYAAGSPPAATPLCRFPADLVGEVPAAPRMMHGSHERLVFMKRI